MANRTKTQIRIVAPFLSLVVFPWLAFACTTGIQTVDYKFDFPSIIDCADVQFIRCQNLGNEEFIIASLEEPVKKIGSVSDYIYNRDTQIVTESLDPVSTYISPFISIKTSLFAQRTSLIFYGCK